MDTKKKAIRLYRKYSHILDGDYLVTHSQIIEMCILCVDEMLKPIQTKSGNNYVTTHLTHAQQKYLLEVKEHLNNM